MNDPYRVLGLAHDASREDISRAYRKLVRRYPPELNPRRFAEIRRAERQLASPDRSLDEAMQQPAEALGSLFPLPEIRLRPVKEPPPRPTLESFSPLLQPLRRELLRELLRRAEWSS